MPMKFFQSPGMIALYIESSGMTRFIHTDGRAHANPPNPSYLGESIGHWEGDTLVVDTTGFVDGTLFQISRDRRALLQGEPSTMTTLPPHTSRPEFAHALRELENVVGKE